MSHFIITYGLTTGFIIQGTIAVGAMYVFQKREAKRRAMEEVKAALRSMAPPPTIRAAEPFIPVIGVRKAPSK